MPYALLALGLLLGFYGLYRFFLHATPAQIKTMVLTLGTGALALALFILAVTGRLPAAIGILAALWPVALGILRLRQSRAAAAPPKTDIITRKDALEILGLTDPVTADDIQEAYKRLMLKVHPDQQGSAWMASRLNAARDVLTAPRQ